MEITPSSPALEPQSGAAAALDTVHHRVTIRVMTVSDLRTGFDRDLRAITRRPLERGRLARPADDSELTHLANLY
jgi:hypothetical protein